MLKKSADEKRENKNANDGLYTIGEKVYYYFDLIVLCVGLSRGSVKECPYTHYLI